MSTDAEWEKWGRRDPYFGVFTQEKYRSENLTEEAKREFFESGRIQISHVMAMCRRHFDADFSPVRALDFGCGTGRLVIPLADIAEEVVGLDISRAMLQEARKNCDEFGVENVSLRESDDELSALDGGFDLIHSSIVFQHIPVTRGRRIYANLLSRLNIGGVCVVQFAYAQAAFEKSLGVSPMTWRLINILKKAKFRTKTFLRMRSSSADPEMQMNPYDVTELLYLVQSAGVLNSYVEFIDHGGYRGVILYAQKLMAA